MNWIDVNDKLPEKGEHVLCIYNDLVAHICDLFDGKHDGSGEYSRGFVIRQLVTSDGGRWADEGVTHWMPLPSPPEDRPRVYLQGIAKLFSGIFKIFGFVHRNHVEAKIEARIDWLSKVTSSTMERDSSFAKQNLVGLIQDIERI